jgi:spore germination protein GerM
VAGLPVNTGKSPAVTPSRGLDAVLYFPNAKLGSDQDCGKVFPVHRAITDTVNDSPYLELLKGPTADELKLGYLTSIPEGVKLNTISQREAANGHQVLLDFSSQMNTAAGSCRVTSIRAQVEQTAKAIDPQTPTEVILSVNGNTDEALQP